MNLSPNQFTSGDSERAEAERGCSKCGKKGHSARTCKVEEASPEVAVVANDNTLAPAGSERLARLKTLRDVNVYMPGAWDAKDYVDYGDSHPRNKGKWQIWRAPDGWIHVWHDDVREVTLVGPSNVCFATRFKG